MASPKEPHWLTRDQLEAIHDVRLSRHGGWHGRRDASALESALGRPRHKRRYRETKVIPAFAAAYGFAITKNHAFVEWNGWMLRASELDAVTTMLGVADGSVTESALGSWLRANGKALKRR